MKGRACLWQSIRDELRHEIEDRSVKADDRFYSLDEVCRRFTVSAITARRVFAELEKDGWLRSRPFKGTFVNRRSKSLEILLFVPDFQMRYIGPHRNVAEGGELEAVNGVVQAARERQVELRVAPISSCSDRIRSQAVILVFAAVHSPWLEHLRQHNRLVCAHVPASLPQITTVRADLDVGARLATRHLVQLGHRRIALLTYMIYSNLLSVSQAWVAQGKLRFEVGIWAVHVGMFVLLIVLFYRRQNPLAWGRVKWR